MILRLTIVRCECWTEFVVADQIFLGGAVEWSNGGYVVILAMIVILKIFCAIGRGSRFRFVPADPSAATFTFVRSAEK